MCPFSAINLPLALLYLKIMGERFMSKKGTEGGLIDSYFVPVVRAVMGKSHTWMKPGVCPCPCLCKTQRDIFVSVRR